MIASRNALIRGLAIASRMTLVLGPTLASRIALVLGLMIAVMSMSDAQDSTWVEDAVPVNAGIAGDAEGWTWISSNPSPYSGALAHQSNIVGGLHQHYFYGASATLTLAAGDSLYSYVYLDPANPPSEVMLQWNDGSWEHRAYWGANQVGWGSDGTTSRRYMGPLPVTGQWVRLEVPASAVDLEGHVLNGMAFTLYDGRVTFDAAGKSSSVGLQNQSMSFAALSDKMFGAAPFTVGATASSGLPVSFSSLTLPVCTVSGATVTLVASGTCTLRASQGGDANYAAAPNVDQSFAIGGTTAGTAWVEDAVPAGAGTAGDAEGWAWISSNPSPYSGALAHQSNIVGGLHQHYFYDASATLAVAAGDSLYSYVYLDPANPPSEVMLQWNDGSWEHRAYWGANQVGWGSDSTTSRRYMGPLPVAGQWVRLDVPASAVDLEGHTLNGMAFTLYDGRATFDAAGKSSGVGLRNQTISFAGLSGKTFGAAPFPVGATASSALSVSFSSLTLSVCTISGNTVTLIAGGVCTVRAAQAGDASYRPAPDVDQSFVVSGAANTVWVEDAVPLNAGTAGDAEGWNWIGSNPTPFSGALAHQSNIVRGLHQHYFYGASATLAVAAGDSLYSYVYLDPADSPSEVMLQWNDGSWEHRAYWGANQVGWGSDGTSSRRYMGPLPASGQWVRLEVPSSAVDLEGHVLNGMAYTLYDGRATFDAAGKSSGVTLQSQSISFSALSDKMFGAAPFTIGATASSGLAVSFASLTSTACTVSGNTVTIVSAGVCTIAAAQSGSATHAAAPNVDQSFTITQASQSITFAALTDTSLGAGSFTVAATASSGLEITLSSLTNNVCTVAGLTVTLVTTGTCSIRAAQAGNTNYAAAPNIDRSFVIVASQTNQAITFGALSGKTFGTAPFTVVATVSSGLPVSFSSLTVSVCTVSGSTVTIAAVGTCSIRASQAGNASYRPAPDTDQSFVVTQQSQTITFAALSTKVLGAPPFAVITTASSGLIVTVTSLSNPVCTVAASMVTLVGAGACTLRAVQGGSVNYAAAPDVDQTFAVTASSQVGQTITFSAMADQFVAAAPSNLWASASSALPVDFSSLTPAICSVAGSQLTSLAAGVCTVRAAQPGNASYSAAPNVDMTIDVTTAQSGPQFAPPVNYAVGTFPDGIATGDFNGDGRPDLAVVNYSEGTVDILLGRGDGTFLPAVSYRVGVGPMRVATGDFNGDGKSDLAVTNLLTQNISVLLGNGDGTFAPSTFIRVGVAVSGIAAADLNGDGKVDLVATNFTSNGVTGQSVILLFGNGDGTFQTGNSLQTGLSPMAVAIADVNGDGKQDLVVANRDSNTVAVHLGAVGGFFSPTHYAVGLGPHGVAVADLNGDGKPDVVVSNGSVGSVSVLLNRGNGTFLPAVSYTTGVVAGAPVIADFTGDGKPDIAVLNELGQYNVVLLPGNGDGTFQAAQAYGVLVHPLGMVTADFNGDGKPDLAIAAAGSDAVSVLLNTGASGASGSLTITSGSGQSAAINSAFSLPLAVTLHGASGQPVANATVTFTAPVTGASGAFGAMRSVVVISAANGVATAPTFTANGTTGSFRVTAIAGPLMVDLVLTNNGASAVAPTFTSLPPPGGNFGVPYFYPVIATGSPAATFSVLPNALPTGLALNSGTGVIAGTPIVVGTFAGIISASNGIQPNAGQTFAIAIAGGIQTITFGTLSDKTFGAEPFAVAASASSGLAVAFTSLSEPVCTMNGNTVTVWSAGMCTIRSMQAGNANYAAAANIDRSFTVMPSVQTITFSQVNTGHLPIYVYNPTLLAVASSGLSVSFSSITPNVCIVNGGQLYPIAVGTCVVRAAQPGNGNFLSAQNIDQVVTIARGNQEVTFAPPGPQVLRNPPVPLSAYATSGLPVEFLTRTPSVCTVEGAFAILLAYGTCTIEATQSGNASYQAALYLISQSFEVYGFLDPPSPTTQTAPLVEYVMPIGGSSTDRAFDVGVAADGSAYLAGLVASTDFPGLSSATTTNAGADLLVVSKLNAVNGSLTFSVAAGGRTTKLIKSGLDRAAREDEVEALAVDAAGIAYVAAYAYAVDMPVHGGTYAEAGPKNIQKITSSGLVQTVGGPIDSAVQTVRALAVDAIGNLYFTGVAAPGLATTAGAALTSAQAPTGGPYLIKTDQSGATVYATYLTVKGSRSTLQPAAYQSQWDRPSTGYAIAVDALGNAYVAGQATAADFPVTAGSPDSEDSTDRDAFVLKVSPGGDTLLFVARLGQGGAERATSVALAADGAIVIGGKTSTYPFRGVGGTFQGVVQFNRSNDLETGFVAKLADDGKNWLAVAAVGSSGGSLIINSRSDPNPLKVAVDATGAIYAAGTHFPDHSLPLLQNLAGTPENGVFVMKMSADLRRLLYSTSLGFGVATGLALDRFGNAYVAGYDEIPFVAKLNDLTIPLALNADINPARAGQLVTLQARTPDARYAGTVEFSDNGVLLGSASSADGIATLGVTLQSGVHRIHAKFQGGGPFGNAMAELIEVVNQASGL